MSTNKSVLKSAGVIGIATLCSRILGFCRDIVIARLFGVQVYAQAFVVAFKIPNLFRDFVAEGATNAALVPVFSEYSVKHSKEEFWELANVVLNLLLVVVSVIVLMGMLFAPAIVRVVAPGFSNDPVKLAATIQLTRFVFPYLLLVSLAAYCMGLLNSLKSFAVSAFAPCLLNSAIIICAIIYGEGIKGLALGVLLGGVLQLAVQFPVLYKKGFRLKLFSRFRHPAAKIIGLLMVPRVLSSSIYQLNNLVDTIFASLSFIVGDGAVAVLYFSYKLVQFPLGIFSTALSQAILPTFSIQALEEGHLRLKDTLSWGLRMVFFILIPASVGFMVLSLPIVTVLFEGGRFDAQAASLTARALFFYSIGLCAFGGSKILQSCFFALKDTVTPTKNACLALLLNIILGALLMFPLKSGGLALATSISGIISFAMLFARLKRKLRDFPAKEMVASFLKILVSSIAMGLVCYLVSTFVAIRGAGLAGRIGRLLVPLCAGGASYCLFCMIFGVREFSELLSWLKARLKGT